MVGVGVVGAGYWANNMLRVIADSTESHLVGICDLSPQALDAVGRRYPSTKITSNLDDLLQSSEIDVVYVATPPASHFDIASAALRAGKHVLVEKPITTDSDDALELTELAAADHRTLMVGHTFLYSPPVIKVKELIERGTVGDIFYMDSQRVNLGKYQDSGVLLDLAPHDLSIMFHWLGETPINISASGRSFRSSGAEDVVFLAMEFPSGAIAQLHVSWLAPVKLRRTTISGSQRMVVYDDTAGPESVKVFNHGVDRSQPTTFGEFQLSYRHGDIWIPRLDTKEPLRAEWEHFVDCVRTDATPVSPAIQGWQVVKVMEAAKSALSSGRRENIEWRR
jgi:predicted dehydrogenase